MSRVVPSLFRLRSLALCALCVTALGPSPADARPSLNTQTKYYAIDATTVPGILEQLKQRGPRGHWAYTDWYVRWTGACQVSVSVNYILPRHTRESAMDPATRQKWQSMLRALTAHEENHGKHGINAAREIRASGCRDGDRIIRKWSDQDGVYDRKTGHGRSEGVVFR